KKLRGLMRKLYPRWEDATFFELLNKFALPENKRIQKFSKGMKAKLALAVALSHHAELLILDEPTSGLDPVVREEILDILLECAADEAHSVLISSHITSDLKKIADSIVLIHNGKLVFQKPKDDLIYQYGVLRCTQPQFETVAPADVVRYRTQGNVVDALIADRKKIAAQYPDFTIDAATLDDIMLLYIKGSKEAAR
ncbi:MAG: ABC transporter ATP-binding protein, partial [Gemmiger sp.]|nr:ABC transporter ATP-binding protein [Gemmiger sp.]